MGQIVRYVGAAYAVSYAAQAYVWLDGGIEGKAFPYVAPAVMLTPGILALVFLTASGEGWRRIPWGIGRPRYLAYGVMIPALTAVLCVLLIEALGLGQSPHLTMEGGHVVLRRGPFLLGRGEQSLLHFGMNLVVTALAFSLINGLGTVGEELGWRGFLQPKLVSRVGLPVGLGLVGLIWAHWHTPIILMGYNFPRTPVLGAVLLWPLTCILLSVIFGWLVIAGRSIWPAVLAHASYNTFHGGLVDGMEFASSKLGPDLLVLGVWLLIATIAAHLLRQTGTAKTAARPGMGC